MDVDSACPPKCFSKTYVTVFCPNRKEIGRRRVYFSAPPACKLVQNQTRSLWKCSFSDNTPTFYFLIKNTMLEHYTQMRRYSSKIST